LDELKPTTAGDLRKKVTKLVSCESGTNYLIRKMPLPAMAKFFNAVDMKLSKDVTAMQTELKEQVNDPVKIEKLILAMRDALPQCIIEPKVSSTEQSSDTVINVDDIPLEDQFELFGVITDFSGISIKALEKNKTFRK
jgi:hypothetical protein